MNKRGYQAVVPKEKLHGSHVWLSQLQPRGDLEVTLKEISNKAQPSYQWRYRCWHVHVGNWLTRGKESRNKIPVEHLHARNCTKLRDGVERPC